MALALLSGCTLESFDVTPCLSNDKLAFRIYKINGWFSDYEPRPTNVLVLEEYQGKDFANAPTPFRWPGMWSAELRYYGDGRASDRRFPRRLIIYGQRLAGWATEQRAKPLVRGKSYRVMIGDGGHHGESKFTAGAPLTACF